MVRNRLKSLSFLVALILTPACSSQRVRIGEIQGAEIKDRSFSLVLSGSYALWWVRARSQISDSTFLQHVVTLRVVNKRSTPLQVQFDTGGRLTLSSRNSATIYSGTIQDFVEHSVGLDGLVLYTDGKAIRAELIVEFDTKMNFPSAIELTATTP